LAPIDAGPVILGFDNDLETHDSRNFEGAETKNREKLKANPSRRAKLRKTG
jgi:hypothetical protein